MVLLKIDADEYVNIYFFEKSMKRGISCKIVFIFHLLPKYEFMIDCLYYMMQ